MGGPTRLAEAYSRKHRHPQGRGQLCRRRDAHSPWVCPREACPRAPDQQPPRLPAGPYLHRLLALSSETPIIGGSQVLVTPLLKRKTERSGVARTTLCDVILVTQGDAPA